jgi:hypothetical protein
MLLRRLQKNCQYALQKNAWSSTLTCVPVLCVNVVERFIIWIRLIDVLVGFGHRSHSNAVV